MRAHEQRIDMEYLRSGWLVICVVQPHQSVPQQRRQLTACGQQLHMRTRSFNYLRQVSLGLQLRMVPGVHLRSPVDLLALAEDLARQLEVAELLSQRKQAIAFGL